MQFNDSTFNTRIFNAPSKLATIYYVGTGILFADGERIKGANTFMTGSGVITVSGQAVMNISVNLIGSGSVYINGGRLELASAFNVGTGTLTIQPLKVLFAESVMRGTSIFSVFGIRLRTSGQIVFLGDAGLTVLGFASYFFVSRDGILKPLGVLVLRDSRYDLLPGTQENTERIPGRHGEIDFGSELLPRAIELDVITPEFDLSEREQVKRNLAKHLNPLRGEKSLVFADDIEKTYYVKYVGRIQHNQLPNRVKFIIPFKASNPFIVGTFIKMHTGSGIITNNGTVEAPLIIEIKGIATDPSVQVGGETLTYTGSLGSSDVLIIDTEKMTVTFNGQNALANFSGGFPKLEPGDTEVTAASEGTTVFKWYNRWV